MAEAPALTFSLIDDLALAVQVKRTQAGPYLQDAAICAIGPLVELAVLSRAQAFAGLAMNALPSSAYRELLLEPVERLKVGQHRREADCDFGVISTDRDPTRESDVTRWVAFCSRSQSAMEKAGIPKGIAQQLVGAVREIEENVQLHSKRPEGGIVAYRASKDGFEFAIGDGGIGVLRSLQSSPSYETLKDCGTAIRLAMTDGHSRFGEESGHGYGFRALFVGLANLRGYVRFRSGDHALVIDGTKLDLLHAQLIQRAPLQGTVVSVCCAVK